MASEPVGQGGGEGAPESIVVAGASGVVGRHLVAEAVRRGSAVRVLTRRADARPGPVTSHAWDPAAAARGDARAVDAVRAALDGADVVVNLAGASLAEGRLGAAHRALVLGSRVDATRALVAGHRACARPPATWVQASATGFYGDTGEALVDEAAPRGDLFLSEVCAQWEACAREVAQRGAGPAGGAPRLVVARLGLVLATDAPAWQAMLLPIRLGLGGPLGGGWQWYAWIDADDLARALLFLAGRPDTEGVYNLTAPEAVRQVDLARRAALLLNRPAFLPAPAFALRLALGRVADELLLPSCRAVPARLSALGFRFERRDVDTELLALLPP